MRMDLDGREVQFGWPERVISDGPRWIFSVAQVRYFGRLWKAVLGRQGVLFWLFREDDFGCSWRAILCGPGNDTFGSHVGQHLKSWEGQLG